MGLGIHSGNTKSTALKTEFKIASVERCMRWYKRFHNSCKRSILQVFSFTGLLLIILITLISWEVNWPRVKIGNKAEGCVKIPQKGTLSLLKRKMNRSSWKVLSKISQQWNISHVQELRFHFIIFTTSFIKGAHPFQRNNQSSTRKHVLSVVKFHFTSVVVECSERWWAMKTMLRKQVYYHMRNIVALTFIISGCSGELRMC